jgi:hypothetical protein
MRGVSSVVCLVAAACQQPPVFYGLWSFEEITAGQATVAEPGSFEILDDDTISLILSYELGPSGFVPDAHPKVVRGAAARVDGGTEEDPVYSLYLQPFGETPFEIVDYDGFHSTLRSPAAVWPGGSTVAGEVVLVLAR